MAASWNVMFIQTPYEQFHFYTATELLNLGINLSDVAGVLNEMPRKLQCSGALGTEMALLDRMYWKIRHIFRSDKQRCAVGKVRKCLKRFYRMNISLYCKKLNAEGKQFISTASGCYLASNEMYCYMLTRLCGLSQLLMKTVQYIEEAYYHVLQRIYLGHYKNICMIFLAIFSRLWVMLRSLILNVVDWYAKLKPIVTKLKTLEAEVNVEALPEDLAVWLSPNFETFISRTELRTPSPESEKLNESIPEYMFNESGCNEEKEEKEEEEEEEEEERGEEEGGNHSNSDEEEEEEEVVTGNQMDKWADLYVLSSDEEVEFSNNVNDKNVCSEEKTEDVEALKGPLNKQEVKIIKEMDSDIQIIEKEEEKKETAKVNRIVGSDFFLTMKYKRDLGNFFKQESMNRSSNRATCISSQLRNDQFNKLRLVVKKHVCLGKHSDIVNKNVLKCIRNYLAKPKESKLKFLYSMKTFCRRQKNLEKKKVKKWQK